MYYTLLDSYTVTFSTKLFIITNLIIVFCEKYNLIILLKITFGHFISFSLFELRICEIYLSIAYKFSSFCYFWNIVQGYTTCHYYLFMEPDHNHIVVTKSIFFFINILSPNASLQKKCAERENAQSFWNFYQGEVGILFWLIVRSFIYQSQA